MLHAGLASPADTFRVPEGIIHSSPSLYLRELRGDPVLLFPALLSHQYFSLRKAWCSHTFSLFGPLSVVRFALFFSLNSLPFSLVTVTQCFASESQNLRFLEPSGTVAVNLEQQVFGLWTDQALTWSREMRKYQKVKSVFQTPVSGSPHPSFVSFS